MKELNLKLSITNLFPNLLPEEAGNIVVLKNRCEWRGIEIELHNINNLDEFTSSDIYFIGSGAYNKFETVAKKVVLLKDKLQQENNAVILGISDGYKLLGKSFKIDNQNIDCLSLLDIQSERTKTRYVGNITSYVDFLEPNSFVGFENHNTKTYTYGETKSLTTITNNKPEGAYFKNIFGTNLHGPVLANNPHFADYLIKLALRNKYNKDIELTELNDDFEIKAHKKLINKPY